MWHTVCILLQNINVFVSFITMTLWQNTWGNKLDGRLIWGHGFRGSSPWFIGSNAFGPVEGEASWHGACGATRLLTHGSQGAREMGCRVCEWPWFQYFPAVSPSDLHSVSSLCFRFYLLNPWCAQSPKTSIQFILFRCLHKTPQKSRFYFILQLSGTIWGRVNNLSRVAGQPGGKGRRGESFFLLAETLI